MGVGEAAWIYVIMIGVFCMLLVWLRDERTVFALLYYSGREAVYKYLLPGVGFFLCMWVVSSF